MDAAAFQRARNRAALAVGLLWGVWLVVVAVGTAFPPLAGAVAPLRAPSLDLAVFGTGFGFLGLLGYRVYLEWDGPDAGTPAGRSVAPGQVDGYERAPGLSYECENCGTTLYDDLDMRGTGPYRCGRCGHELNNQDGASDTYHFG